ncbi:MAG TPA: XRE family transcriptional regulator [Polyangiaceae bacterium]|nr:XRE family transcriptional regulator [Polyangiaceae bacterium]
MGNLAKKVTSGHRREAAHGELGFDIARARLVRRGPARTVRLSLRALRESSGKTQAQVAKASGLAQPDVSKLEKATSLDERQISTIRRYLAALGDELELVVVSKYGHRIALEHVSSETPGRPTDLVELHSHIVKSHAPPKTEVRPTEPVSGRNPNVAGTFSDAAAPLITGKRWDDLDVIRHPQALTKEQRQGLSICMQIAAMFGKPDRRLSDAEKFTLERMAKASTSLGVGELTDAKARAVIVVKEAKGRYSAASTGGARGLIVRQLVGDLEGCSDKFKSLLTWENLDYVDGLLGGKYGPARVVAELQQRVGWIETARSRDVRSLKDANEKAYRRKRPSS